MDPFLGGGPGGAGGGEKPITASLNQKIIIRPNTGKVDGENVVVDRPELFSPVDKKPFKPLPDGKTLQFVGVRLGQTRVRIFDPDKPDAPPYTVQIQIVPDIVYLNQLVRYRFPMANLLVTAAGDNFLFVDGSVDNPADVEAVEDLLKKFFVGGVVNNIKVAGVMQVQLEVVIARVDRTHLRQFGVNILMNSQSELAGTQIGNLITTPQAALQTLGARIFQPLGPNQAPLNSSSTAFFGVSDQSKALYGFIEALRQHNLAKVLANPTLVTLSGRQADFLVGGEQPIPVNGTITAPTVSFKAFGTRLTFLPTVLGGGKIRLDVVPEVSTTDFTNASTIGGLSVPQFVVQRLHATVELQAGQTLCLGGLLQTTTAAQSQKVPFLGELPGIGTLFRRVSYQTVENELLVLVTPRLFNPLEGCEVPRFLPGQQTFAPTDAQFFGGGMIESANRDGSLPFDTCHPPQLGDLIGPATLPPAITSCRGQPDASSYQNLIDAVCPSPLTGIRPIAPGPAAAAAPAPVVPEHPPLVMPTPVAPEPPPPAGSPQLPPATAAPGAK
jgi:pilus assembly protein CpaC